MARKTYTLKSIYLVSILIAIGIVAAFLFSSDLFLFQKPLQGNNVVFEETVQDEEVTDENETTVFDSRKIFGHGNNLKLVEKLKAIL